MNNQSQEKLRNKSFGFVLKTVERCNINCTYCYFFNGIDDSFKKHSPYIKLPVISQLCEFLLEGIHDLAITDLKIGFHGGEPMMQKLENFDLMCFEFENRLKPYLNSLHFTMQTNGMLVNYDWLHLLRKYKVGVGVSIDGPKDYNDKYRIDKRGLGTYERVVKGTRLLQKYLKPKKGKSIGALTVINPEFNGKIIYRHLVDLGFEHMDFLLPDFNYLLRPTYSINEYSKYLLDVFQEWVKDDNSNIEVRFLNSIINTLLGGYHTVYGFNMVSKEELPLITISSDGGLAPVDELRSTRPELFNSSENIFNTTLAKFLDKPIFEELAMAQMQAPVACRQCIWKESCCGGHLVNRYSKSNGFNNPTIYCESMKHLYPQVVGYLLNHGVEIERIKMALTRGESRCSL